MRAGELGAGQTIASTLGAPAPCGRSGRTAASSHCCPAHAGQEIMKDAYERGGLREFLGTAWSALRA